MRNSHQGGGKRNCPDSGRLSQSKTNISLVQWPRRCLPTFFAVGYLQTFGCETCRNPYLQYLLKITSKNLILAETDNPSAEP